VTVTEQLQHELRPTPRDAGLRRALVAAAAVAAIGVWVAWRLFVATRQGQQLEGAAFEGAELGRTHLWKLAEPVLDVISVSFIATVLGVSVVVALVRRRWLLAAQVVLLVGGANLTTQLLKYVVFDRPDFDVGYRAANTLPSGHATAAASCAVALLLVVPRRYRAATAVAGTLYAAGTGVSTLVGGWHRPGDVVAAALVVLAWTCLVGVLGPAGGSSGTEADRRREVTTISLLLAAAVAACGGALAAAQRTLLALDRVAAESNSTGLEARSDLLTAYGGGALAIIAVVCGVFGVVLVFLRIAPMRNQAPV
jgi:membrane-associated phospholipid phosphatase